jgi:L,D-transpeptidase ErfK/SrfK
VALLLLVCWNGPARGQAIAPLSAQIVGQEFTYTVGEHDSLASIGARFGVSVDLLTANNNLSPSALLNIGQPLVVDNRHIVVNGLRDGITINIPQRMLFYFRDGRLIRHFPVGLGRPDRPTPTGPFKIVAKVENPTWYVPQSIQEEMRREGQVVRTCVPPGPDNELGIRWMGLSIPGYGIHGTNDPANIYQFRGYGCILAHNDDVAQLFDDAAVGTDGSVVYRRLLITRVDDRVFLEVHPDIYKRQPSVQQQFEAIVKMSKLESMIDRDLAREIIRSQEGIARDITRRIGSRNAR